MINPHSQIRYHRHFIVLISGNEFVLFVLFILFVLFFGRNVFTYLYLYFLNDFDCFLTALTPPPLSSGDGSPTKLSEGCHPVDAV